jgi:hypothetical protein
VIKYNVICRITQITQLLSILLISGCKKDVAFISSSSLIGEWSWISTCGGIAGICYTPKSTNQRVNLVFAADSTYKSFINDTLKSSGNFHIYKSIEADTKDTSTIVQFGVVSEIFMVIRDTLYFTHNNLCFDCFGSSYKRIK